MPTIDPYSPMKWAFHPELFQKAATEMKFPAVSIGRQTQEERTHASSRKVCIPQLTPLCAVRMTDSLLPWRSISIIGEGWL
mgnify:CR=1 FL=1